jgi:hypothetical protein
MYPWYLIGETKVNLSSKEIILLTEHARRHQVKQWVDRIGRMGVTRLIVRRYRLHLLWRESLVPIDLYRYLNEQPDEQGE